MSIPQAELDKLSPTVRRMFLQWDDFLHRRVQFNMADSKIHAAPHCERVLLYALILGEKIFGDDEDALTALAHAAVFHDTRRQDDYLDTGHGARAAVYYQQFCKENPGMRCYPESAYLMRYHDLDDSVGRKAIEKEFGPEAPRVLKLYDIFKDSDALDRWRLGHNGLDPKYLRTPEARNLVDYSRRIVEETMPERLRKEVERQVDEIIQLGLDSCGD